jgi:hypothetical protein
MMTDAINFIQIYSLLPEIRAAYNPPQELLQQPNDTTTRERQEF